MQLHTSHTRHGLKRLPFALGRVISEPSLHVQARSRTAINKSSHNISYLRRCLDHLRYRNRMASALICTMPTGSSACLKGCITWRRISKAPALAWRSCIASSSAKADGRRKPEFARVPEHIASPSPSRCSESGMPSCSTPSRGRQQIAAFCSWLPAIELRQNGAPPRFRPAIGLVQRVRSIEPPFFGRWSICAHITSVDAVTPGENRPHPGVN